MGIAHNKRKISKFVSVPLVALFWLGLWQLLSVLLGKPVLLPSPMQTLRALWGLMLDTDFWLSAGGSLLRIGAGFFLGMLAGCAFGLLCSLSPSLKELFSPLLSVVKTTPVASFIILLLVWLSSKSVPTVTAMLIVLPAFWSNVMTGISQTDPKLLEMAKIYRLSPDARLHRIYLPTVAPYFISAANVGVGMAWKAGVAAELICSLRSSIGGGLYDAKIYLETDKLFAWTLIVIILSMLLETVLTVLINRISARRLHHA